ncbi:MAG: type II toxin-antitoxin system YoeB family toxin [Thermotogota bacterium]
MRRLQNLLQRFFNLFILFNLKSITYKIPIKGVLVPRIDLENRLVYAYLEGEILVISCRFHY